jgi:hypothetical protein
MKSILTCCFLILTLTLASCSDKDKIFTAQFSGELAETKWAINELNPDLPSDWSAYSFLTFDLRSTTPQRFELRLYDDEGIRRVNIHPFQNAWIRASIPLINFQKRNTQGNSMASINKTARPGYWIGFSTQVGPITRIDSLGVLMRLPINEPTLEIRNVILTMEPMDTIYEPIPLVDELGQWIPDEWPGKVSSLDELKAEWAAEEASLKAGVFGYSKYGGYLAAKTKATGFFRVEKIDDKWWFVDPEGYLFYSAGSTGIRSRSDMARLKGREYIFKALPDVQDNSNVPTSSAGSSDPSIYTWNLSRRFGSNWVLKWKDLTEKRMGSWGLIP